MSFDNEKEKKKYSNFNEQSMRNAKVNLHSR